MGCTAPAAAAGVVISLGLGACQRPAPAPEISQHVGPPPSERERYCAWFGDERDGTLYMGLSPFWNAMGGADGDPRADLEVPGPQPIGVFDLGAERFLPPLEVGLPTSRGGVWDVLAHPNGRVYFSTYFDSAGSVDPGSGQVKRFAEAGMGLNELVLGPDGAVLATRYGLPPDDRGSVVVLAEDGQILAEHLLTDPAGARAAAKSLAWDPHRREIWVNTDLLPDDPGGAVGHDVRVLDEQGHERHLASEPELQFMVFGAAGGVLIEREGRKLSVRWVAPGEDATLPETGSRVTLDTDFPVGADFAQDVRLAPDGSAVVTRWGGKIHRVWPDGRVRTVTLPRDEGLFYTGVVAGDRLCTSLCADVRVVCRDAPG